MTRSLGTFVRERRPVFTELGDISRSIRVLLQEVLSAADLADERVRTQTRSDFVRRAALGYDFTEVTLEKQFVALADRKLAIKREIDLWIEVSFDHSTVESLKARIFPAVGVSIIGGGVVSSLRSLREEVKHLLDEAEDIRRRLAFFAGPGEEPPEQTPPSKPLSQSAPPPSNIPPTRLFVAYSRKDTPWLDRLVTHFSLFQRNGTVDVWSDRRITPGTEWQSEVESALENASVAVLLVSADFLASDFSSGQDLPRLLRAQKERGLVILPIYLGPCYIPSEVLAFQGLNTPHRTLTEMPAAKADRVLVKLVEFIARRAESQNQK